MVLEVGWNLGTPEENHAFAAIWERITMLVRFKKRGPCKVRELQQGLASVSSQTVYGFIKVLLVLVFADVAIRLCQ